MSEKRKRKPRPRFRGICALCYVDPNDPKKIGTNATTQVCRKCRRDPLNKGLFEDGGWVETWEDSDEGLELRAVGTRLADVTDKKLRDPTEFESKIKDLATRGAYEPKQYHRSDGRKTGKKMAYVRLSFREIARRVGCSEWYVRNVIKKQLA